MGRTLDWQALETVCALLGVEDVDMLVIRLAAIRDWAEDNRNG